ncbi:MAG: right-handed parallel beta-helix repeat-containing protein, partial [Promethearchaeota archaeon]
MIETKKKIKISSLIILISIFSLVIFLSANFYNNPIQNETKQELSEFEINQPKVSKFWDEDDVTFIYIKNDNWSATDLEWVQNRTGSPTDPHIIENVTINGQGLYNCIKIENCSQHFIIRNCTLYNAGNSIYNASISIVNSINGTIINNTCFSSGSGIYLYNCDDMLILNNTVFSNYYGILLHDSDNNDIIGNRANNNSHTGIKVNVSTNN